MTEPHDYRFDEYTEGVWPNGTIVVTATHVPSGRTATSRPQASRLKARVQALSLLRIDPPDPELPDLVTAADHLAGLLEIWVRGDDAERAVVGLKFPALAVALNELTGGA